MILGKRSEENHMRAWKSGLSEGAQQWVYSGEHGLSSVYLLYALTGYFEGAEPPAVMVPVDTGDLRRCLLMLEQCGLSNSIHKVKAAAWEGLLEDWLLILKTFEDEVPDFRDKAKFLAHPAQRTRKLIDEAVGHRL
jgi:hypothetical protein